MRCVLSTGEFTSQYVKLLTAFALLCVVASTARLLAHPAPFSYLDVHVTPQGLTGRLALHDLDIAHDLKIDPPALLADPAFVERQAAALAQLITPRVSFFGDGRAIPWTVAARQAGRQSGRGRVDLAGASPASIGRLTVAAHVFPTIRTIKRSSTFTKATRSSGRKS